MRIRAALLLSGAALSLQLSCRTEPPEENYRPAPASGAGGRALGASGGVHAVGAGGSSFGGEAGWIGFGGDGAGGGDGVGLGSGGKPANGAGGGGSLGSGGSGTSSGGAPASLTCPAPPSDSDPFSRAALRHAAATCAEWVHCRFEEAAGTLAESVQELDGSPDALALAQSDWRAAMSIWAIAEAMQFGPVASPSESQGRDSYQGLGLRDLIYSWPQVARCRVDEQVVNKKYETQGFQSVSISGRGLFGLEVLLEYQGLDTSCSTNSTTYDLWSALSPAGLMDLRERFAKALATDVHSQALGLKDSWSPQGRDFLSRFTAAEGYPSEQEAMNVLGWALLYLEVEVKDWKLGVPAGYTASSPVLGPEAGYADFQTEILRSNIEGFRLILEGCSPGYAGIGFDDWLIAAGHEELAIDLLAATRAAQATLGALPAFSQATPDQIEGAYVAVKAVTDLLKGDLFGAGSPLNLKLPSTVEGDTD